jgi:hypothetical protein
VRQLFSGDADSRIGDFDQDDAVACARAQLDATAALGVLHGVLEQCVQGQHDLVVVEKRSADRARGKHEVRVDDRRPACMDLFEQGIDIGGHQDDEVRCGRALE